MALFICSQLRQWDSASLRGFLVLSLVVTGVLGWAGGWARAWADWVSFLLAGSGPLPLFEASRHGPFTPSLLQDMVPSGSEQHKNRSFCPVEYGNLTSPAKEWALVPGIGRWILNLRVAREFPCPAFCWPNICYICHLHQVPWLSPDSRRRGCIRAWIQSQDVQGPLTQHPWIYFRSYFTTNPWRDSIGPLFFLNVYLFGCTQLPHSRSSIFVSALGIFFKLWHANS